MAVTFGFYNSVEGDRVYDALQMSSLFDGIIVDGVFMKIGNDDTHHMQVAIAAGRNVSVDIGRAWFNHTWTNNDSLAVLAIDSLDEINHRIDAIVLEVNANEGVRANSFKVVKGTAATSPVRPTLTNSGGVYQHPLAYVMVPHGSGNLDESTVITNTIGTADCPFVTGPLTGINAESLISGWQAEFSAWFNLAKAQFDVDLLDPWLVEFNAWFDAMKDQLTEDAAGNLQTEIDAILAADLQVVARQGEYADNDWNSAGVTNYIPPGGIAGIQVGNNYPNSSGIATVTFPVAFTHKPVVFCTVDYAPSEVSVRVLSNTVTTTGFLCKLTKHLTAAPYHEDSNYSVANTFNWLAIGPVA